jgi:hypothetical protein
MGSNVRTMDEVPATMEEKQVFDDALLDTIRTNLNPRSFTLEEVIEEFGKLGGQKDDDDHLNRDKRHSVKGAFDRLVEAGRIVSNGDGTYRISDPDEPFDHDEFDDPND